MENEIVKQLKQVAERLEDALEYVEDRIDALSGDELSDEDYEENPIETIDMLVENWLGDLRVVREKLNGTEHVHTVSSENQQKRLVHEFWAYDMATDIAKGTLDKLGIPFTVETERQVRDPSAPEDFGRYDEWAEIYVEEKDPAAWLEKKIEEEINSFER